jgi:hypothetical protein
VNNSEQNETMYCEECESDVPVEKLEDGTIIIHCPKCIGECVTCDCYLASSCFSSSAKVVFRPLPAKDGDG